MKRKQMVMKMVHTTFICQTLSKTSILHPKTSCNSTNILH
uniref:Uncharacterized protein n=1 Tax=Anguilla anguilla TaxID=7936 RepID=A0A0E9QRM4_ANGAN